MHKDESLVLGEDLEIRQKLASQADLNAIQRANGAEAQLTQRTQIFICEMIYRRHLRDNTHRGQLGFQRAGIFPFDGDAVVRGCRDFVTNPPQSPTRASKARTRKSLDGHIADIIETAHDVSVSPLSKLRRLSDSVAQAAALADMTPPPPSKMQVCSPDITSSQRSINGVFTVADLEAEVKKSKQVVAIALEAKEKMKAAKVAEKAAAKEAALAARKAVKETKAVEKAMRAAEKAALAAQRKQLKEASKTPVSSAKKKPSAVSRRAKPVPSRVPKVAQGKKKGTGRGGMKRGTK